MYLTMNSHEFAALARMNEPRDVRSVQLSRRDSLDNLMTDGTGALVVSVVPVNGETFRIAIGETGAMVPWGDKPEPRTRMSPFTREQHACLDVLGADHGVLAIDARRPSSGAFLLVRPLGGHREWIITPDGRTVPCTRRYGHSTDIAPRRCGPWLPNVTTASASYHGSGLIFGDGHESFSS